MGDLWSNTNHKRKQKGEKKWGEAKREMNRGTKRIQDTNERQEKELEKQEWGGEKKGMKQEKRGGVRSQVKKSQRDSPNESILRPTGADGGRLGPSIIGGGDGAPPLTGEGPYESPVTTRPSIYSGKVELLRLKSGQDQVLLPL